MSEMSRRFTEISEEAKERFAVEAQLHEAVKLLDDFLQIGPNTEALTGFANEVERFFRHHDFESILPVHDHMREPPKTMEWDQ